MRVLRGVAVGGAMALAVAGCAADGNDSLRAAASTTAAPATAASAASTTPEASGGGTAGEVAANGETIEIRAIDNNFVPQKMEIAAGTEVRWVNGGRNPHDVLPEGDPQATAYGVQIDAFQPGDKYSHVFGTPGTYVYYCSVHGTATAGMFGTIVVTGG